MAGPVTNPFTSYPLKSGGDADIKAAEAGELPLCQEHDLEELRAVQRFFIEDRDGKAVVVFRPKFEKMEHQNNPNATQLARVIRRYTSRVDPTDSDKTIEYRLSLEEIGAEIIPGWKEDKEKLEEKIKSEEFLEQFKVIRDVKTRMQAAEQAIEQESKAFNKKYLTELFRVLTGNGFQLDEKELESVITGHEMQGFGFCLGPPEDGQSVDDISQRPAYMYYYDPRLHDEQGQEAFLDSSFQRLNLNEAGMPPIRMPREQWLTAISLLELDQKDYYFRGPEESSALHINPSMGLARYKGMINLLSGEAPEWVDSQYPLCDRTDEDFPWHEDLVNWVGSYAIRADAEACGETSPFLAADQQLVIAESLRLMISDTLRTDERMVESERKQLLGTIAGVAGVGSTVLFVGIFLPQIYFMARQQGWTRPVDPMIDGAIEKFWGLLGKRAKVTFVKEITPEMIEKGEIKEVKGRKAYYRRIRKSTYKRKARVEVDIARAGVGKTTAQKGFAYEVYSGRVPEFDPKKTDIWMLNLGELVGSDESKYVGQITNRWNQFTRQVEDAASRGRKVVVFIDELHRLAGAGATSGGGSNDLLNAAKDWLSKMESNPNVRIRGATTKAEYPRLVAMNESTRDAADTEVDEAAGRRFPSKELEELTDEEIREILDHGIKEIESVEIVSFKGPGGRVQFEEGVIERAIALSKHPSITIANPDAVLTIVDEAQAEVALRLAEGEGDGKVTLEMLERTFAQEFGYKTDDDYEKISKWKPSQDAKESKAERTAAPEQPEVVERSAPKLEVVEEVSPRDKFIAEFLDTHPDDAVREFAAEAGSREILVEELEQAWQQVEAELEDKLDPELPEQREMIEKALAEAPALQELATEGSAMVRTPGQGKPAAKAAKPKPAADTRAPTQPHIRKPNGGNGGPKSADAVAAQEIAAELAKLPNFETSPEPIKMALRQQAESMRATYGISAEEAVRMAKGILDGSAEREAARGRKDKPDHLDPRRGGKK